MQGKEGSRLNMPYLTGLTCLSYIRPWIYLGTTTPLVNRRQLGFVFSSHPSIHYTNESILSSTGRTESAASQYPSAQVRSNINPLFVLLAGRLRPDNFPLRVCVIALPSLCSNLHLHHRRWLRVSCKENMKLLPEDQPADDRGLVGVSLTVYPPTISPQVIHMCSPCNPRMPYSLPRPSCL